MANILFASSEVHPLAKTGGLADVSASLPPALMELGADMRVVMPAYRGVLENAGDLRMAALLDLPGSPSSVRILEGRLPSGVPLWLVDSPLHFDRDGGPYLDRKGKDWPDNAERFTLFARAIVKLASNQAGLRWQPDVVHCNDWQTGLVPALLRRMVSRPATVFTIHNLAYQGLFPWEAFASLGLPRDLWSMDGMEFHGLFSFIKGGLAYADRLTTVSPSYAGEIRTPEFGEGLEGLLSYRADRLSGILNGVDYSVWDPSADPHIPCPYDSGSLEKKAENKAVLCREFGIDDDAPLVGLVGRLAWQKGFDIVLDALPRLLHEGVHFIFLGSGDATYERALKRAARDNPGRVGVHIGYNEDLAHLVEAGADMFLMPSRYEPCGLNQIYSLRYGTPPIVRATGGLRDTVRNADSKAVKSGKATGFVFTATRPEALTDAVRRAVRCYRKPETWRRIQTAGMAQDFSWAVSARHYLKVYEMARAELKG